MNEHEADAGTSDTEDVQTTEVPDVPTPGVQPQPVPTQRPLAFATRPVLAGTGLNAAIAVAATLVAALVTLFVLILSVPQTEGPFVVSDVVSPDLGMVLSLVGMLAAYALGGELNLEILGAGQASLVLLPLTLIVGIALASSWWGFRAERTAPLASILERMLASAATGVIAAGVVSALAAISAIRSDAAGVSVVVTSAGWRVFLTGLVVIAASAFVGRVLATRSNAPKYFAAFAPALRSLAPAIREAVGYAAILTLVFVPVAILVALVTMLQSGAPGGSFSSWLLFGVNSTFFVAALAHFGSVTFEAIVSALGASQGDAGTYWAFSPELGGGWGILLPVVALVVTAYAMIWVGLRRSRTEQVVWGRAWGLPVITLVAWIVLAVFAIQGTFDASGTVGFVSGSLHGAIGFTWWTPLLMAFWAGVASVGAEFAPGFVYSIAPGVLGRIGGRQATEAWILGAAAQGRTDAASEPASSVTLMVGDQSVSESPDRAAVSPPSPMDPQRRRRLLIGGAVVGGVAVLAVATAVTLGGLNASRSPEARVAEYVGHIAHGEAERATAVVDPNVPNAERFLLTDAALAGAEQRISDVRTELVSTEGDTATVGVTYRLDGVDEYAELRAKRGPNEFGVLETWRVIDPLVAEVEVFTNVYDEVTVGAVDVTIEGGDASPSRIVYMYPGVYEVVAPDSEYYTTSATTVRAAGAAGSMNTFVEVLGEPTEELTAVISEQVKTHIDECVKSTEAAPDGCPLSTWTSGDAPVTWSVVEYPDVELYDATAFETTGGEIAYAYTYSLFGREYSQDGSREPRMFGGVRLDGDEVVVTFAE